MPNRSQDICIGSDVEQCRLSRFCSIAALVTNFVPAATYKYPRSGPFEVSLLERGDQHKITFHIITITCSTHASALVQS